MAKGKANPPATGGTEFPVKVDRNVYPRPEYRFPDVKVGMTYKDSAADFPKPLQAPQGAPNILLVLLDDVGFGWPSAFGGGVRMPTAERPRIGKLSFK